MDAIHLDDLSGYTEDKVTLRKLQGPYRALALAGILVALGGFLLLIAEVDAHNHPDPTVSTTSLSTFWLNYAQSLHHHGLPQQIIAFFPVAVFLAGLVILAGAMIALAWATPISQVSGQRMEKYWSADTAHGDREVVYIDEASKTYFRRAFAVFGFAR